MAYGNYYPGSTIYGQPMYNQPMGMPTQAPQPPQDDRIWVASEQAAEAYQIVPNGFVRLWDSQLPVFYEKRADPGGRPMPLVSYEYKVRTAQAPVAAPTPEWEDRLKAVEKKLKEMEGTTDDA